MASAMAGIKPTQKGRIYQRCSTPTRYLLNFLILYNCIAYLGKSSQKTVFLRSGCVGRRLCRRTIFNLKIIPFRKIIEAGIPVNGRKKLCFFVNFLDNLN